MKTFLFSLICFVSVCAKAQKLSLNAFAGVSNYQGDLQSKLFVAKEAQAAIGAGLSYELIDNISIRSQFIFASVSADDKNGKNIARNLNFTSKISELSLVGEYYFLRNSTNSFKLYVFAGVAGYHFNPATTDKTGAKYYLAKFNTEGEGFYQDRKTYNLFQFAIPFGGGFKYAVSDNVQLGLEFGMRKLFTDYLDDVSTTFIDKNILLTNSGAKAVELAYRGNGAYPADGIQRGSPKSKDWYYFMGITSTFKLFNRTGDRRVSY